VARNAAPALAAESTGSRGCDHDVLRLAVQPEASAATAAHSHGLQELTHACQIAEKRDSADNHADNPEHFVRDAALFPYKTLLT